MVDVSAQAPPRQAGSVTIGPDGPESLSWSLVSTFDRCSESYRLRYIVRPGDEKALGAGLGGSAIHHALEEAELQGWFTLERERALHYIGMAFLRDFADRLAETTAKVGAENIYWGGRTSKEWPDGETPQWWEKNWKLFARRAYVLRTEWDPDDGSSVHLEASADGEPAHPWVEKRIAANIVRPDDPDGKPLRVTGSVDVLMFQRGGEYVIRDYKTSGSVMFLSEMQLATYAWLIEQAGGPHISWGEFAWLRGASRATLLRRHRLRPDLVPEMFLHADRGIRNEWFAVKPSDLCRMCTVRHHCRYGKDLEEGKTDG